MSARNITITSWVREQDDPFDVIAVPGLKFTGWWHDDPPSMCKLEQLNHLWPSPNAVKIELDILEGSDFKKHQLCAYVRIRQHPQKWLQTISKSLESFIERGAAIAWAGGWECFLTYSPTDPLKGCYAAYTVGTGFLCFCDLDEEPFLYLDQVSGTIARLHAAVSDTIPEP